MTLKDARIELVDSGTHKTRAKASRVRKRHRISVVIPAKNEARNICWVLERMPNEVDEIVLVDGRSTDRTVEVALALRPNIVVVHDDAPGKGCAIRKGIETATGDFVVMLDADGSMDPGEIGRFVQPLSDGQDLVRGSRFMPGGGTHDISPVRSLGNHMFLLLTRILYGVSRSDLCYGYAAFRRSSIMALGLTATGFEIEAQLFLRAERAGLAVTEVPSFEATRRAGTSNLHAFRDGWRVLLTILGERLRTPERPRQLVAVPMGEVAPLGNPSRQRSIAFDIRRTVWEPLATALAAAPRMRPCPDQAPDERAMTAALVWSLAVEGGDSRLRAVALADYRDARRRAAAPLPIPISILLRSIRQEAAPQA